MKLKSTLLLFIISFITITPFSDSSACDSHLSDFEKQKKLFPEFTVRIYACSKQPIKFINSLEKKNAEVILKKSNFPWEGVLWRILPTFENHEVVLVRDCDTRLSERERT